MSHPLPDLFSGQGSKVAIKNDSDPDKRGFIRLLTAVDVNQDYVNGLNDEEVRRWISFTRAQPASLDGVRRYVDINYADPSALLFGLFVEDRLRGTVRLHDIDFLSKCASVGILIFDKSIWGKSWGFVILVKVVEIAFERLSLEEISAGIDSENVASLRVFEKAGFEVQRDRDISYSAGIAYNAKICKPISQFESNPQ